MNVVSLIKNKAIGFICIASFLVALLYNETNLKNLPTNKIRNNETVITSDDASYLTPPKNYITKGEWKDNAIGKQAYFIRPPGYGLFYMIFLKIADYPLALKLLKIAQLLLFSCSVYWLYFIGCALFKNKKLALIGAIFYGLAPFSSGFLFYTLTEGITPALILLFVFLLLNGFQKTIPKQKTIFYFLAAIAYAYLLLIRPQLGFFGILIPFFLVKDYWSTSIKKAISQSIIFIVIGFSFWSAWQYRNYKITNQILPPHPIYYADGNSFFRPPLKEYWNFVGGWAQKGSTAYSYMVPMWKAAIKGDTSITYINNALTTFPAEVVEHFGKGRLINTFRTYQATVLYQKPYFEKHIPMPEKLTAIETKSIDEFNQLTNEYKSHFWFDYHIKAPLKVFKIMAFHSNLSLYIFQHTYRGNWLMELTRYLFFGIHSMLFLLLIANLLNFKKFNTISYGINLVVFSYIFYLCYFQRGIEERYTLPILPILIVGAILFFKDFTPRLKKVFSQLMAKFD